MRCKFRLYAICLVLPLILSVGCHRHREESEPPPPPEVKVGAVVRLKSGSSRMTVEKIDGAFAECVWEVQHSTWNKEMNFERAKFEVSSLQAEQ